MNPDREKLEQQFRDTEYANTDGFTPSDMADIAIAYADRRVAEAVTMAERLYHEAYDDEEFLLTLRALSPAREGGNDE